MRKLLLIATGGTIASKNAGRGLAPSIDAAALLKRVPALRRMYDVKAISPVNLDSTNMRPCDWLTIADAIRANYAEFDGFVVAHGTDTMAYTAAALSYLIESSPKPIALTGAQKSIATEDTDARTNLMDAFAYAADPMSRGVVIVFDGRVIVGTRARKIRSKSRNAFESVDYPDIALVRDGRVIRYILDETRSREPRFSSALNGNVVALKLIPGLRANVLAALSDCADALVIEGFGVGGVPTYGGGELLGELRRLIDMGKTVAVTTQVPYEGSDLALYEVGRAALEAGGVLEAYTMTPETCVIKLMWILAQTRERARVADMFYTPVAHDLLVQESWERL